MRDHPATGNRHSMVALTAMAALILLLAACSSSSPSHAPGSQAPGSQAAASWSGGTGTACCWAPGR